MKNIEVQYLPLEDDKESVSPLVVKILPVKRNKYKEVSDLSLILLQEFSRVVGYPGELIRSDNENVWGNIAKLVDLLPLAGGGKLDCDRLSDDDVIRIFFTRSLETEEDGRLKPVKPNGEEGYAASEIAKLHGFDFFRLLQTAVQKSRTTPPLEA